MAAEEAPATALCAAGPTHPYLAKHFPDLKCDRERGHPGAHHESRRPGRDDYWLGGCIAIEEELVLRSLAEAAADDLKAYRTRAREAKRAAKASGELFTGGK